ncbi:MAG: class I SAM-dependent methyltransferase [Geminicoccaceae bacterium]
MARPRQATPGSTRLADKRAPAVLPENRPMQLTPTAASPLAIDDALLWRLFEPFTDRSAGEVAWTRGPTAQVEAFSKNYLRRRLLGRLTGSERSEQVILDEYEILVRHRVRPLQPRPLPEDDFILGLAGTAFFATDVGGTRFRQLMLIRAIELTRPRSVRGIGCGNGINLILLACRFPEVSFTGLELTEAGQRATGIPGAPRDPAGLPLRLRARAHAGSWASSASASSAARPPSCPSPMAASLSDRAGARADGADPRPCARRDDPRHSRTASTSSLSATSTPAGRGSTSSGATISGAASTSSALMA